MILKCPMRIRPITIWCLSGYKIFEEVSVDVCNAIVLFVFVLFRSVTLIHFWLCFLVVQVYFVVLTFYYQPDHLHFYSNSNRLSDCI